MSPFTRICQAVLILVLTAEAQAKSATEIFESASGSVVVVYGNDVKGQHKSLGSGVVLPGGAVVTNCHVIEKSDRFVVKHQQREYPAILKHADHDRDVCSLSVEGLKTPAAQLGTTKTVKVGQRVYAIGAPQGLELTLSEGIVSSLREVEGGQYIQTSAPISPGSSGGGLFDEEGRLIGLPTFYLADGQQLNFAVPVEWVKELPQRQVVAKKTKIATLAWLNKAVELENKADWPALTRHAQNWTKSSPDAPLAWYVLGTAYRRAEQPNKAIEAYRQALRIYPGFAEAWYFVGLTHMVVNQASSAIEALQQAVRIKPEYVEAWNMLGNAYGVLSQPDKGIVAQQQALRIDPTSAEAWFGIGLNYYAAGQPGKAIESFRQVLGINPEDGSAWIKLGLAYHKTKQYPKAIDAYKEALRINPESAEAWFFLADAYIKTAEITKATGDNMRVLMSKAIDADLRTLYLDPDQERVGWALAMLFSIEDMGARTIESLVEVLRANPADAQAWYSLGIAYQIEGQSNRLLEIYRELKKLSPQKAEVFFAKFVLP